MYNASGADTFEFNEYERSAYPDLFENVNDADIIREQDRLLPIAFVVRI